MESDQNRSADSAGDERDARDNQSGLPGGGVGRREDPGHTGVYPVSSMGGADNQAQIKGEEAWGQGERGAEGYQDSGGSELFDYGSAQDLGGEPADLDNQS